MYIHNYGDVTVHACHGTPPSLFSTVQYNYGFSGIMYNYSLVYDSNQTRNKCKVIEEVNQTVKSIFEQALLMYLSPVHT